MNSPDYTSLPARFWDKVEVNKETGCWEWTGALQTQGYGVFRIDGKAHLSHRLSLSDRDGDTSGQVLHHCDNPPCVLPAHLYFGTQQDNVDDMHRRRREARGERMGSAKLSEADVLEIRRLAGSVSKYKLANQFGVSRTTILLVTRRETWSHV